MTISSSNTRQTYSGDGSTVEFSWSHRIYDDDDLSVILEDSDGVFTDQVKDTDYTISVESDYTGATVTMTTAPAADETLILVRKSVIAQSKAFGDSTVINMDNIEENFDRFALMMQDLQAQVDRSLKTDLGSGTNALTVPEPSANKFLAWNDAGDDLENTDAPSWISQSGAPSDANDGNNGDMYLRTDTGEVYGPKTNGAWGAVVADVLSDGAGDMLASIYDPTSVEGDAFDMDNMVEGATTKILTDTERSKLSGIEANADVTDATNVDAAGAAMLNQEDQTLAGGAAVTVKDLGTKSSGTLTLDMGDRPLQKCVNGGAFTLAPGTVKGSCLLTITNNASAGSITTTGWTNVVGDSFDTTDGNKFLCHCVVDDDGDSILNVQAYQ